MYKLLSVAGVGTFVLLGGMAAHAQTTTMPTSTTTATTTVQQPSTATTSTGQAGTTTTTPGTPNTGAGASAPFNSAVLAAAAAVALGSVLYLMRTRARTP